MWLMDYYFVANYGNEQVLESTTWVTMVTWSIGFIIGLIVYLHFIWRICMFTGKLWIAFFMVPIGLAQAATGFVGSILSMLSPTWDSYLERGRGVILGNTLFILGDALSFSIMAWHLNKSRDHGLSPLRTNLLVNRLIVFAVATGGITVLVDIVGLVLMLTQPLSLAFVGPMFVQTRIRTNSILASLNLRNANKRAYEEALQVPVELPTRSIAFAPPPNQRSNCEETN